jgi:hypothetical protein
MVRERVGDRPSARRFAAVLIAWAVMNARLLAAQDHEA